MGPGARHVTLVTAPNCHLCGHARHVLARLERDWSFMFSEAQWDSPEGEALVRRDGVPFPPALYTRRMHSSNGTGGRPVSPETRLPP